MAIRETQLNPCLPCLLLGNPGLMPPPGDVAYLGKMLEVEHELPDGKAVRHEWTTANAPHLFWNDTQKALYSFPGLTQPRRIQGDADAHEAAADAYRRWTGQNPTSVAKVTTPKVHTRRAGRARHILYRTNKWTPNWTNYVHPFEGGVNAYLGPGSPPAAFHILGGDLRVTARGLEG